MVTPLTREPQWRPLLDALPVWEPPSPLFHTPTVVLSPHPDDETLGAGGLVARLRSLGTPVAVVAVTDGEAAYLPVENGVPDPSLALRRAEEQTAALSCLDVPSTALHRLHLPDACLHRHEPELRAALRELLPPGSHLVAPWPHDFHPDHETCGRVALALARELKLHLTFYVFWTWHRGTPELLAAWPFVRLPLSAAEQHARLAALMCHTSQLTHASGQPILPMDLLDPIHRPFEVFLPHEQPRAKPHA